MTTLTFLGLTGGAGATTLVAMTVLAHPGSERTLPELTSHDPATLEQRIGQAFPSVIGKRRIADAGRYSTHKLHTALRDGHAVLVAPLGARGDRAVDDAIHNFDATDRRVLGPHVSIARVAVNGPMNTTTHPPETFILPYDRLLAHGTPLIGMWHRLSRRTDHAMIRWNQLLEDHLWRTRPLPPGVLETLQNRHESPNPWTQQGPATS